MSQLLASMKTALKVEIYLPMTEFPKIVTENVIRNMEVSRIEAFKRRSINYLLLKVKAFFCVISNACLYFITYVCWDVQSYDHSLHVYLPIKCSNVSINYSIVERLERIEDKILLIKWRFELTK